jgi:WhiB family redox-sensing transcriptional regulator
MIRPQEEVVTVTASPDPAAQQRRTRPAQVGGDGRASWRDAAACRFLDTDLFFPIGKAGLALAEIKEAKSVCERCQVRPSCLAFALDTHQGYGIWGGYDEDERRLLLRRRQILPQITQSMQAPDSLGRGPGLVWHHG